MASQTGRDPKGESRETQRSSGLQSASELGLYCGGSWGLGRLTPPLDPSSVPDGPARPTTPTPCPGRPLRPAPS